MSLYEAGGQISKSMKDLKARWQAIKSNWNDEQADRIEKELLPALERDVRSAAEAIDTMKTLTAQAKRDTSEG